MRQRSTGLNEQVIPGRDGACAAARAGAGSPTRGVPDLAGLAEEPQHPMGLGRAGAEANAIRAAVAAIPDRVDGGGCSELAEQGPGLTPAAAAGRSSRSRGRLRIRNAIERERASAKAAPRKPSVVGPDAHCDARAAQVFNDTRLPSVVDFNLRQPRTGHANRSSRMAKSPFSTRPPSRRWRIWPVLLPTLCARQVRSGRSPSNPLPEARPTLAMAARPPAGQHLRCGSSRTRLALSSRPRNSSAGSQEGWTCSPPSPRTGEPSTLRATAGHEGIQ